VRLFVVLGFALAAMPGVALATRPSVSPVAQAPGYVGYQSGGGGSNSELAVKFDMTIAANTILSGGGGEWYAYTAYDIRVFTDCSQSPIKVRGSIDTSLHRRRVSRRVYFSYRSHGVSIRGYFFGPLGLPRMRATAKVARARCHDVVPFTASWHMHKPG
jgi:hypothetical protein